METEAGNGTDAELDQVDSTIADTPDPFWQEGYEAFFDGLGLEECPYGEGTDGEFGWKHGWRDADKEVTNG